MNSKNMKSNEKIPFWMRQHWIEMRQTFLNELMEKQSVEVMFRQYYLCLPRTMHYSYIEFYGMKENGRFFEISVFHWRHSRNFNKNSILSINSGNRMRFSTQGVNKWIKNRLADRWLPRVDHFDGIFSIYLSVLISLN